MLHATDDPSQIAPSLRCLGIPPPESTVMARAVAARAALRSSQPRLHDGATGGGGSRRSSAVERAFRTGLTALGSQGCMRTGAAATAAVVLKGGDRAVWPVGAEQLTDVRACHSRNRLPASSLSHTYMHLSSTSLTSLLQPHSPQVDVLLSNTSDAISCLASRFKHYTRGTGPPPAHLHHFDVLAPPSPSRSLMVRFILYSKLHDPTWAKGVRRRSVWVLSPAGFAYRRQSLADEASLLQPGWS